jgi:hypothetical protein
MAVMDEPSWRDFARPAETTFQFGIRDLLIAQAVCAVCLGLFAMVGGFAVLAIFIATLVLCALDVEFEPTRFRRCLIDLLAGVVLPALTFVCTCPPPQDTAAVLDAIAIASQLLALLAWMIAASRWNRCKATFAGILAVGVTLSGLSAVLLFPLGMITICYYGLGLFCFVPILTCCIFVRNVADAIRGARAVQGKWTVAALFLLGVVIALAIPSLIYVVTEPWLEDVLKDAWPQELFWRNVPWRR